jgi:hypothetical protein
MTHQHIYHCHTPMNVTEDVIRRYRMVSLKGVMTQLRDNFKHCRLRAGTGTVRGSQNSVVIKKSRVPLHFYFFFFLQHYLSFISFFVFAQVLILLALLVQTEDVIRVSFPKFFARFPLKKKIN